MKISQFEFGSKLLYQFFIDDVQYYKFVSNRYLDQKYSQLKSSLLAWIVKSLKRQFDATNIVVITN